ncbi:anti-sigma factor antagonist [Streptomyces sp. NPDC000658]|uniref:anti-sigma factor antagonist n=1 Tax=Streptomyces sp. NPDC000658 TaxID=3154266 RepID=UPI0033346C17
MPEPAYDANAAGEDVRSRAETNGGARQRPSAAGLVIGVRPGGGRVVVTVRGELDLETNQRLERALRGALAAADDGIDVDLGGVAFCDCSALNVLLGAREHGLREGKTVAVRTASPAVARLLDLTGVGALFDSCGATADAAGPTAAAVGDGPADAPDEGVVHDLRLEVVRLRRALRTRPVIDLAGGIVMASFGLGVEEARRALALAARNAGVPLHHLARDLVRAVQDGRPAGAVHEAVAAAAAGVASETVAAVLDGGTDRTDG